jgi:hypothetical protein
MKQEEEEEKMMSSFLTTELELKSSRPATEQHDQEEEDVDSKVRGTRHFSSDQNPDFFLHFYWLLIFNMPWGCLQRRN